MFLVRAFFTVLVLTFAGAGAASAADSPRETPVVRVIREWAPSVVNISTERVVLLSQHPFWSAHGGMIGVFDDPRTWGTLKLSDLGSGVIVSEDGLIVTNAHVVHMASRIYVTLQDGATAEARLIGTNDANDIALIQIDPPRPLKPVRFAEDVWIGETVIAVGNSFGLQNSVSVGVVSGTNRTLRSTAGQAFDDFLQTDASINPGSSGGALLNLEGRLVGINLAIIQNAQNIAFAIPAAKVRAMLSEYDKVKRQSRVIDIPVQ